jgi:mannosyltransferase
MKKIILTAFNSEQNFLKITQLNRWVPIVSLLLLATILRLYQLDTEGLWKDEMFSVRAAENFTLSKPGVRPVYFFLLSFWMQWDTSDAWLRSLAVLFGIGSVFLIYQLGLRIATKAIALIAALIMALSPLFLWHSQEIRFYTLSTFLTLAGAIALTDALKKPKPHSLATWAITRLLAILTTPLNVTLLLPDTILFCWKFRQQRRWLLMFGMGLLFIGIAWLPVAFELTTVSGPKYMNSWASETPKPTIGNILSRLLAFTVFWPPAILKSNNIHPLVTNYYQLYTLILIGLFALALFIAFYHNNRVSKLMWLVAWVFLPASVILLISYLKSNIWLDRYLLFVSPYIFLLLAASLMTIWYWQRRLAIVLAILYLIAVGGGLENYYRVLYRDNWQGAVQSIYNRQKSGDVIVYYAPWSDNDESLTRYYKGNLPIYHIENSPQTETWGSSPTERQLTQLSPMNSRLWLVCWELCNNKQDIKSIEETIAGKEFQVEKTWVSKSPITASIEVFAITPDISESKK